LIAALAIAGAAASPAAADARRQAEAHARRGVALYNLGKFEGAIAEFEQAYTLVQSEALLFNLGQAHRQLDHCEEALRYYRRFLATTEDADRAGEVRRLVPKLEVACAAKRERPDSVATDADGEAGGVSEPAVAEATITPTPAVARPVAVAAVEPADADVEPEAEIDDGEQPEPAPGTTPAARFYVSGGLVGGAVFANTTATTAGASAGVVVARRWAGRRWLVGGEVAGSAVIWADRSRSGVSPAVSAFATIGARLPSPVTVEASGGVGALILMGLDQRGHALATSDAGAMQAVPGVRGEILIATPLGTAFELYAGGRAAVYAALGGLDGDVLLELSAAAGLRYRR
jgi:tetratricopeptide (TPR) repeat protein